MNPILPLKVVCLLLALLFCLPAYAMNISSDHPQRCGSLQCFPASNNPNEYYYLPANPHLSTRKGGTPEFSFMRYVDSATQGEGEGGITEAGGGGIVHFLVDYSITKRQFEAAEAALKEQNESAILKGPVLYEKGQFALVSAFAPDGEETSDLTRQVIGIGRAPLIEGLKAAVSMHLTKRGAQILWRSFQMQTPDISLVFEMSFSGLSDPVEATITADWTKLREQADKTGGLKLAYANIGLGFDYKKFWDKAHQSGAISIDYKGDSAGLQAVVDRTYVRLQEIMFEPLPIEAKKTESKDSPIKDVIDSLLGASKGKVSYPYPWEAKISGGYKRRKITRTGKFQFDFRQRSQSTITTAMAGNIGNLYHKYGDNKNIFATVNLGGDTTFLQREITVGLDAHNSSEFGDYINHVTLSLRKTHGSGEETIDEVVFSQRNYTAGKLFSFTYPWDKEVSQEQWRRYRYKVGWSFVGGAQLQTDWLESDSPALTLTPPYQFKRMEFLASPDVFAERNVRLATVRVWHDFYGRSVQDVINLGSGDGPYRDVLELAVPEDQNSIEYEITWRFADGGKLSSGKMVTDDTIIFCDEIPRQQ